MSIAEATVQTKAQPQPRTQQRIGELDGIRGWAAFSVICFHMFWETFGILAPSFRNPLTAGLLNGAFDVEIFFILSGDALSTIYFSRNDESAIVRTAITRYLRLAIPIAGATLLVFLLMKAGVAFSPKAASVVHREDWLGHFANFKADYKTASRFVVKDVFISVSLDDYMPFLWTMPVEWIGSIAVFVTLLCYKKVYYPKVIVCALAVALIALKSHIGCFFIGVFLSNLRFEGFFERLQERLNGWIIGLAFALLYGLVTLAQWENAGIYATAPIAAIALVIIYSSPRAKAFFAQNPVSKFLGHISFPLYLIQYPVLISLTSYLILRFARDGTITPRIAFGIAVGSVLVSVLGALFFSPVERATHIVNRWLGKRLVVAESSRAPR